MGTIERGERNPTLMKVYNIAKALNSLSTVAPPAEAMLCIAGRENRQFDKLTAIAHGGAKVLDNLP
ncbi:MAG: hypothetical protein HYW63_00735 [Candidatus Levybacteria bacterium]|nr:hypothetical protein [Candidatus Levybacteria bacterium]